MPQVDIDRLARDFWFRSIARQPALPVSNADLDSVQRELGLILPDFYRRVMSLENGGTSNYVSFERGEYYVPIPCFDSLEMVASGYEANPEEDGIPEGILVIGSNGHDFLGFDYRENPSRPAVVYREDYDSGIEQVSRSIDEFLSGLQREPD